MLKRSARIAIGIDCLLVAVLMWWGAIQQGVLNPIAVSELSGGLMAFDVALRLLRKPAAPAKLS